MRFPQTLHDDTYGTTVEYSGDSQYSLRTGDGPREVHLYATVKSGGASVEVEILGTVRTSRNPRARWTVYASRNVFPEAQLLGRASTIREACEALCCNAQPTIIFGGFGFPRPIADEPRPEQRRDVPYLD